MLTVRVELYDDRLLTSFVTGGYRRAFERIDEGLSGEVVLPAAVRMPLLLWAERDCVAVLDTDWPNSRVVVRLVPQLWHLFVPLFAREVSGTDLAIDYTSLSGLLDSYGRVGRVRYAMAGEAGIFRVVGYVEEGD